MKLSYEEMQELARNAHNGVSDFIAEATEFFNEVEKLAESWSGSDHLAFSNAVLSYKKDIENLGKVCNDYAVYLDDAAVVVSGAQDEVRHAAQQL